MTNLAAAARRVMVVEDNADNAELLRTFLQMDRHEVKVVNDGPSALELASSFQPDAVLLDVGLPGMDGLEVARRLRETRGKGLLLVALTGHAREEDRKQALASGFDHHFTKPLDLMALRELLAK
jgi:CheY-like chemotaxis protein